MPDPFIPPTTTPGAYLKHRRQAALLTVDDVAARVSSEPRVAQHLRAEQIELIEADAQPATFATIVALNRVIPFDLGILARLVAISQGHNYSAPQLCRICAHADQDWMIPGQRTAGWADPDLCQRCANIATADAA